MMTPLREEIKPENSALDSLYKELDIYIEELNGEEMVRYLTPCRNKLKKVKLYLLNI
jgi:hypothetical protein